MRNHSRSSILPCGSPHSELHLKYCAENILKSVSKYSPLVEGGLTSLKNCLEITNTRISPTTMRITHDLINGKIP